MTHGWAHNWLCPTSAVSYALRGSLRCLSRLRGSYRTRDQSKQPVLISSHASSVHVCIVQQLLLVPSRSGFIHSHCTATAWLHGCSPEVIGLTHLKTICSQKALGSKKLYLYKLVLSSLQLCESIITVPKNDFWWQKVSPVVQFNIPVQRSSPVSRDTQDSPSGEVLWNIHVLAQNSSQHSKT